MKHELRKLQIDNDKLKQSLRQKLDLKGVATKLKQVVCTADTADEFTVMIREGFVTQMQQVNRETLQTQELLKMLTQWVKQKFTIRITQNMSLQEVHSSLQKVSLRLNEGLSSIDHKYTEFDKTSSGMLSQSMPRPDNLDAKTKLTPEILAKEKIEESKFESSITIEEADDDDEH